MDFGCEDGNDDGCMVGCKDGNEDGVTVGSHVSPSIDGVVVSGCEDGNDDG